MFLIQLIGPGEGLAAPPAIRVDPQQRYRGIGKESRKSWLRIAMLAHSCERHAEFVDACRESRAYWATVELV